MMSGTNGFSQLNLNLLRLEKSKTSMDSNIRQAELLAKFTDFFLDKNTDSMIYFRNELIEKINSTNSEREQLKMFTKVIRFETTSGFYHLTKLMMPQAISLSQKLNDKGTLTRLYYFTGYYYQSFKANTDSASTYFLKALRLTSSTGDKTMQAHINSAIGLLYLNNGYCDSAWVYVQKSKQMHESMKDKPSLLIDVFNLGSVNACKGELDDAKTCFETTLAESRKVGHAKVELNSLYNLANIYNRKGTNQMALEKANELYRKANEYSDSVSVLNAITLIAAVYFDLGKHQEAFAYAQKGLSLAEVFRSPEFISSNLDILIKTTKALNDYKASLAFFERKKSFDDSLSSIRNIKYLESLKTEYNLDLKNREILEKDIMINQKAQESRTKTSLIILLLVCLVLMIIFFVQFRSRKKAESKLNEQTLANLAVQQDYMSFIQGQEAERKRIASDLHDGLAQNLVTLGINLAALQTDKTEDINRKKEIQVDINHLINETRTIAHNMMPDVLTELGLAKALKSLLNKLNQNTSSLNFSLELSDPFLKLPLLIEIQIYRIIQELLNNVTKHAMATTCLVKLNYSADELKLTVTDNGIGFDSSLSHKPGIGIKSINSRVRSLGGSIMIHTGLNKGCETIITIPLNNLTND
jgi:two-component system NarL family sensor kinase